jgi:VWFA-related protein
MNCRLPAAFCRATVFAAALASIVFCGVDARARQKPAPDAAAEPAVKQDSAPKVPAIRVQTRLVQIGVIVRDKSGAAPAMTLTKDDFTVLERGKRREVSFFSVEGGSGPAPPAEALPANTHSDRPQYNPGTLGSVTVVLLDNLNTLYGSAPGNYERAPDWMEDHALANAKNHLSEFIRNLDARDRVAIYGLRDSLHVLCDFTNDRERLLSVVRRYDTRSITNREVVEPGPLQLPAQPTEMANNAATSSARMASALANGTREEMTMDALREIAGHLSNIPGRKNLVWLTASLPFSAQAIASILSRAQIAAYPVDGRGLLGWSMADSLRDQPQGDSVMRGDDNLPQSSEPTGIGTMRSLAELTGGLAFVNTNDLTGAIRKAVEDSAANYTLGFYLEQGAADGKFHELSVTVKGSGLTVRYPKGYFAYSDSGGVKDEGKKNRVAAIASPIESSAIPFTAKVERTSVGGQESLSITGTIDMNHVWLKQEGSSNVREGAVDVTVVQQDQLGRLLKETVNHIPLRMPPERYADAMKAGVRFQKVIEPMAGVVTLRILVQDPSTAELGDVIIPISEIR